MSSPFLWLNVSLLLLALANFGLSVRILVSRQVKSYFNHRPVALHIVLRASSILYAMLSSVAVLLVILLVCLFEVFPEARACWNTHASWKKIHVGMTQQEVVQLLGQPDESLEDLYYYRLHPLERWQGSIAFTPEARQGGEGLHVVSKNPPDEAERQAKLAWISLTYLDPFFIDNIVDSAGTLAFLGIIVLAVVSLLPLSLRNGWDSWMLYTPLITLLLGTTYEMNIKGGWRFDLFLLCPLYFVILGSWFVRLLIVIKTHARQKSSDET
jgi:hypothetical protein